MTWMSKKILDIPYTIKFQSVTKIHRLGKGKKFFKGTQLWQIWIFKDIEWKVKGKIFKKIKWNHSSGKFERECDGWKENGYGRQQKFYIINLPCHDFLFSTVFWNARDRVKMGYTCGHFMFCDLHIGIVFYTFFIDGSVKKGRKRHEICFWLISHKFQWQVLHSLQGVKDIIWIYVMAAKRDR